MLYKLIRDWGGFAKGAVIEVISQDRLAAMNGDGVNPPAGIPYVPEPKPEPEAVLKQVLEPESKPAPRKQVRPKKEK